MEKGFHSEGHIPDQSQLRERSVPRPEYRRKKSEVISSLTPEQVSDLADKVSSILEKMKTIPEYKGKIFLLCRSIAIRAVLNLPRYGELEDTEKVDYEAIISELSRRGGERTGAKNKIKKMHTVSKEPKGGISSTEKIREMIEQAEKLRESEEERAGQTYVQSGIEAGEED
jgi:hypothetical protein